MTWLRPTAAAGTPELGRALGAARVLSSFWWCPAVLSPFPSCASCGWQRPVQLVEARVEGCGRRYPSTYCRVRLLFLKG